MRSAAAMEVQRRLVWNRVARAYRRSPRRQVRASTLNMHKPSWFWLVRESPRLKFACWGL